jgi:hypothetical protein
MEGGSPSPDLRPSPSPSLSSAYKRHKRGFRARLRALSSSGDVTGSGSGDVDGSSLDKSGPSASEATACLKCGRARTDGLSVLANYQQHVASCKGPVQLRSEALVCPCGKRFPPRHKLNFEQRVAGNVQQPHPPSSEHVRGEQPQPSSYPRG